MSQSPDYLRPGVVFKAGVFAGTLTTPLKLAKPKVEQESGVLASEMLKQMWGFLGREKPSVATAAHRLKRQLSRVEMIAYFLTHEGDHESESTVQRAREQMEAKEHAYVLEVEQISKYKITKHMFTRSILPRT